ncbi:MAG TPA: AAA family ATPase [Candidatus Dormibacteraeota bacterium]|nr:AAA family ATPase [Candidatus Dormibacteraeota bacterium]
MVVGREAETALLAGLLAGARTGTSAALVLRGEPGIGKSALLDHAVGLADGFRVLQARGVESESELAFSGLQELVLPVVDLLRVLPGRQRAVLEGALALGPPVAGDPLAVCAATLSLVAAAAEDIPLLLVVDDAHWLDPPSASALAFTARRLSMEGVVALFAMRTSEPSAFDPAGLRELPIGGLDDPAARELILGHAGRSIVTDVVDRLVTMAAGNPLALLEFSMSLNARQLAGAEPIDEPLPVRGRVERAFARKLDELPKASRDALLLVAAGELDEPGMVEAAMRRLGLGSSALAAAEEAGLITFAEGRLRFRHPLVRSVVYQRSPTERRRAVHAALAVGSEAAMDRRSWHLAAAATGPDETAADALEKAADRAAARGGFATATRTYERAAELSPKPVARGRRLLAAATYAVLGGRIQWARGLVDAGFPLAKEPSMRAEYQHLSAVVERLLGSASRSHEIFWDGATVIAHEDPARATVMMIDATATDIMLGDLQAAAASGSRAKELAERCSPALQRLAAYAADTAAAYRGELPPEELGTEMAMAAAASLELSPIAAAAVDTCLTRGLVTEGQFAGGGVLDHAIKEARDLGALGKLPFVLGHGALADFQSGRWARARARAAEAVELAGQTSYRAWGLVHLARVSAAEGHELECRALVDEAFTLARARGHRSLEVHLWSVLGLLELGLGHAAPAADALVRCAREADMEGLGNPTTIPYEPDLAEALHACGRDGEAAAATQQLQRRAEHVRSPWGLATAARCRGLLATDQDVDREFQSALALHEHVPNAFERARTRLCYGERLRRMRRRAEAELELSAALATFEQFASEPWANRARQELRAAGYLTRPQRGRTGVEKLTPQELRVALIIAEGASVREAATQLFLSPKTIEAHLGRVYQKLGVHNRAQLATALAGQQAAAPVRRATGLRYASNPARGGTGEM